ncbi:hypothetical protein AA313_de0200891 [Arthrobotrys entomopaga]|nr:hypothetical protein AA313_de0200891 [Arthrobotrys entomopaga]
MDHIETRDIPAIRLSLPLSYQQEIFREAYNDDAFFIIAKGLGVQHIVANLLHVYDAVGRNLVILVGATESDNTQLGEVLAEKAAVSRAHDARGLAVVNTDVTNVGTRQRMYARGGVFTVTSRILVVDLLTGLLDPTQISGLVIVHAEKVTATSLEAFVIRIYRQKNRSGFIKAFSENPDALSSGFSPLATIMRNLFIQKSSLWPRYHIRVAQSLEVRKADVIELEVSMTSAMQAIQNAALQCIEISISELRKGNIGLDIEDWSVDSALHRTFDVLIRRQLDPVWHRVSSRTRQIASDLTTLRTILLNLLSLDAISFYQYLETILASHAPKINTTSHTQPHWLFLDAAEILFSTARRRVYNGEFPKRSGLANVHDMDLVLEEQPKWNVLLNILDEISRTRQSAVKQNRGGPTLIMCHDRQTCVQIAEYLQSNAATSSSVEGSRDNIQPSRFMARKLFAFQAWKNDFNIFRSSNTIRENQPQSTESRSVSLARKAPANKRRRVRGAAQFATIVRNQPTSYFSEVDTNDINSTGSRMINDFEEQPDMQSSEPSDYSEREFKMHDVDEAIVIHPYGTDSDDSLLEELKPRNVIMYNPNAAFIRRIEVFQSSNEKGDDMRVYFMYYGGSVEEQTYLSRVRKEKDIFTQLIRQKANMAITITNDSHLISDAQEQFLRTLNTRIAGGGRLVATAESPRVIVDVREFRSSLPSLLHGKSITIVPCTLTVGDYILTPAICIERKSIKDLISSFKDGRLYSQVEAMHAGYQEPVLLIEFDQDKSFNLEPFLDLNAAVSSTQSDLQAKLVLLTLHFPKLRIIWSSSPYQTAEIFEDLKRSQQEPDPIKAISIGLGDGDDGSSIYAALPTEMLKMIPGINDKNYRNILLEIDNILELSNAREGELIQLLGQEAGRRAYKFLNSNIYRQDFGD